MSNQTIICPGVSTSDLPVTDNNAVSVEEFFVGSRMANDQIQLLLGARDGESFHIAAILDTQTAKEMCKRITAILECASDNSEPSYSHPVTVTLASAPNAVPETQNESDNG